MKKTFVIILTMLLLVGIVSLYAAGLDEGERRLCHVYGNVHWAGFVPIPPGHSGIEDAHVILQFYYDITPGDDYETSTDDYGDYDFSDQVSNVTAAYTSAEITVIVDEGTGHEQSKSVVYDIPEDPAIPFIAYDEFIFYQVPDRE